MQPERDWLVGSCRLRQGGYAEAERLLAPLSRALKAPAVVHLRLGIARHGQNRLEEAMASYLVALSRPSHENGVVDALMQYGLASLELGLGAHWLRMLEKQPFEVNAIPRLQYLRGLTLLALGRFAAGWRDHEARFEAGCSALPPLDCTLWQGQSVHGSGRLLLVCEQGLGDSIQFLRFVPLLRQWFHDLALMAPPALLRLVERCGLVDQVIDCQGSLPPGFDFHLPLMSLPERLGVNQLDAVRSRPYLRVRSEDALLWRKRLIKAGEGLPSGPMIAMNWQGNRGGESPYSVNRERSVPLAELEQLSALQNARIVSVQQGSDADLIVGSKLGDRLVNVQALVQSDAADLYETAAVLVNCDLLITNDTSVAHLGGALGIPTCLLLKCYPSWQWVNDAVASCWYESVRCFRQHRPFCWAGALQELDQALMESISMGLVDKMAWFRASL
jgi:hypothetical protein